MFAKIGFRVYTPTGSYTDNQGNKFDGLDSQSDQWITLCSPKIARLQSFICHDDFEGELKWKVYIDDSKDPKARENENQIYAVFRPAFSTSYLLIDCLNLFGSEGGYDKILDLLQNENTISFDLLDDLVYWIGEAFYIYHRDFIKKFAPDLKNSIESAILKMSKISFSYEN